MVNGITPNPHPQHWINKEYLILSNILFYYTYLTSYRRIVLMIHSDCVYIVNIIGPRAEPCGPPNNNHKVAGTIFCVDSENDYSENANRVSIHQFYHGNIGQ
jgi:hypothetical protein